MFLRRGGWLVGLALGCCAARAAGEIRPGDALSPELSSPEAAKYEALLQGRELELGDDSVEERRQFTARRLRCGAGIGFIEFMPQAQLVLEVDVWDRLALGLEGGINVWGGEAGGYLRLRPFVWGGRGRRPLHAFTLQAGYRYMGYGEDYLLGLGSVACHGDCDLPQFQPSTAHFLVAEAGFEHALWSGWTVRYAMGATFMVSRPAWRCEAQHEPVDCADHQPPASATFVHGVTLTRALF
jgi:hypothetical protein